MAERSRVAVVGASGFIGTAVVRQLVSSVDVVPVVAPRLRTAEREVVGLLSDWTGQQAEELVQQLIGCDVVVNAAGDPDASSTDEDALVGANALLPAILLAAARKAGVRRLVHVSSAVVQNDRPVLDASEEMQPFSAYSLSKVLGERVLRDGEIGAVQVVRFRPPSVHHESRRVTRGVSRVARSRLSSVAGDGSQPSPQALLDNVASAVSFLALTRLNVPAVVHHPWEGLSSRDVMLVFGQGNRPLQVPRQVARSIVRAGKAVGRRVPWVAANARRVEVMWLGQQQAMSWLETAGWCAPLGRSDWRALAREVAVKSGGVG